jgi:hypothetical protein
LENLTALRLESQFQIQKESIGADQISVSYTMTEALNNEKTS